MRSLSKLLALSFLLATLFVPLRSLAQQSGGRVVLVLPFDNRSGNASLNWIGDSFPDTLNKRLESVGFLTISQDDRAYALDHLGLPVGFKPSRATSIRIAQQLNANYVIVGSYSIQSNPTTPANDRITIQSQLLSIDDLTLSPPLEDSAQLARLFDAENAIAWKIARAIDPHLSVAEGTFLAASGAVPLPAFENYIRGTNATAADERIKRLQSAVALAPNYSAALLALGKEQYAARDYSGADATLSKVPTDDRLALEANFYLGLARFNSAKYAGAEAAFAFVAQHLPLPEVINDQGVALSRQNKEALSFFQRASASDPSEVDYHYNLAIAYFRRGDTADALKEADAALKLKPNDNEVGSLRAHLSIVPAGTRLSENATSTFSPLERIRRNYSEAGFRQAAFQLNQVRAARLAMLPPAQQAIQYVQQGRDFLNQGLVPEAEQEFQSAIAADSNNAAAHAGIAQIRESSGSLAEARTEANKSLQLLPNTPAWLVVARLDLGEKNLVAAAHEVSQALKLDPTNTAALTLRQTILQHGQPVP